VSGVVRLERPSASRRCDDAQNIASRIARRIPRVLVRHPGTAPRWGLILAGGNAGSPGSRPGLDSINVRITQSDSSDFPNSHDFRTLCAVGYANPLVLQFLIQYCTMRAQSKTVTTHPEGQRDRPDEAPATSRVSGLVLTPTARGWKMRVSQFARPPSPALRRPHPELDGVLC